MKRVECGRGVSELISKKWEHKKIGLYYCFEKNNKIYIPFGNRIEIYDKSEYVKLYGDEISEEELSELFDTECQIEQNYFEPNDYYDIIINGKYYCMSLEKMI